MASGTLRNASVFEGLLATAFPFYIMLDRDLCITRIGPSLAKTGLHIEIGAKLDRQFAIKTPSIDFGYQSIIAHSDTVFFLQDLARKLTLKGQMVAVDTPAGSFLLFLCSPVLKRIEEISDLSLTLADFPRHDSTVDFLILLQTQDNILSDTRKMARQLREEIQVRRRTQEKLQETNELLEDKVKERTRELSRINDKLGLWVKRLERRNHEMSVLNAMGEMLQNCRAVKETFPIVHESIEKLFPGSSGRLACFEKDLGAFLVGRDWGGKHPCPGPVFKEGECAALRSGRTHWFDGNMNGSGCRRLGKKKGAGYICRPLKVNNEVLGLLHLRYAITSIQSEPDGQYQKQADTQRKLISTMSEHISLALSNLRLQEFLTEQSIRDPLTGLYNRRNMETSLDRETERIKRHGGTIGIVLFDIDHFKRFNDSHGHQAGDLVLVEFASLIQNHIRGEDIACRYGGEEFMLIMPKASLENSRTRAEQIRAAVANDLRLAFNGVALESVTVSGGVSVLEPEDPDWEKAVNRADNALYKAKHNGRNRVVALAADTDSDSG